MVGEQHASTSHEKLTPYANKVSVPIGNINSLGTVSSGTSDKPFVIYKYISINGERMAPEAAVPIIRANGPDKNISDVYPGTLKHVFRDKGDEETAHVTGLTGQLGVRYGLSFSVTTGGGSSEITHVELDALDLKCSQMAPLEADSKLLYCLINHLMDDDKYRIMTKYVFPMSKLTAITAIYNDQGFMPSIAQITAEDGADSYGDKPGMKAVIDDETGEVTVHTYTPGWEHVKDRKKGWTWGYRTWDEWDYVLLRNSKARIKKLFKGHYNSRDWDTNSSAYEVNGGQIFIKNLKAALQFPAGAGLLSWWQRGRLLKGTPFNANGKICTKKD